MKIAFRTFEEWRGHILPPVPAREGLPDWLREMPGKSPSALTGDDVRTVKHCPPFLDAMGAGFLLPLQADVEVRDGRLSWDWELPAIEGGMSSRSPLGFHVPAQLDGFPGALAGRFAVKFMNFWTISVPEGVSILFTHPVNRLDLPFRTVTGLVDCDSYDRGLVHFPALWTDAGFEGVLKRGTPVAQCIPVRRDMIAPELDIGTLDETERRKVAAVQEEIASEPGTYRKSYRHRG